MRFCVSSQIYLEKIKMREEKRRTGMAQMDIKRDKETWIERRGLYEA